MILTVQERTVAFRSPLRTSYAVLHERTLFDVRLQGDDDVIGRGEAAPLLVLDRREGTAHEQLGALSREGGHAGVRPHAPRHDGPGRGVHGHRERRRAAADPAERAALAGELFDHVGSGRITVPINQRYALEDAVSAHHDLESGRSVGSSVFVLES